MHACMHVSVCQYVCLYVCLDDSVSMCVCLHVRLHFYCLTAYCLGLWLYLSTIYSPHIMLCLSVHLSVCCLFLNLRLSLCSSVCPSFFSIFICLHPCSCLYFLPLTVPPSPSLHLPLPLSVSRSTHVCLFLYYFPSVSLHPSRSLPLVISQPPLSPCSTHHLPVPVNPSAPHPYPVVLSLYARPCNRLRLLPLASLSPSPTAIDVCSLSLTHTDISHSIDSWTIMSPQPPANPHIQRTPRMTVGGARA